MLHLLDSNTSVSGLIHNMDGDATATEGQASDNWRIHVLFHRASGMLATMLLQVRLAVAMSLDEAGELINKHNTKTLCYHKILFLFFQNQGPSFSFHFMPLRFRAMVSTQAKRKKTADMPDSPPKRVTRARAAKVQDDITTKPKTTKITTASTKAAAEKKKAAASTKVAAPAKTSKRKTRAEDEVAETVEEPEVPATEGAVAEEQPTIEPAKPRGRQKKDTVAEKKTQAAEPPKVRTRQTRATPASESIKVEAPKPRGRPKKNEDSLQTEAPAAGKTEEVIKEPAKKTTRARTVTATSNDSLKTRRLVTAPIKKVKFEEDQEKENVPIEKEARKKSTAKSTGLNAKPIQKPAAARVTARGRKTTQAVTTAAKKADENESMPLSPKKVNQVAKSDPISEDELAGEKNPVRALSKSPSKRPASPLKETGNVSKLNFDIPTAPSSPTKASSASILGSPPRRPPPSPFKDALKASPKKLDFGTKFAQPVLLPSRTPMKSSLLQESPKRGAFADSAVKPVFLSSKSPYTASLLQSPARRPNASPTKSTTAGSSGGSKPDSEATDTPASPSKTSLGKLLDPFLEEAASSPFRATRSPERYLRVHVITDAERIANDVERNTSPSPTLSPAKPTHTTEMSPLFDRETAIKDLVSSEDSATAQQSIADMDKDDIQNDTNVLEAPAAFSMPAFAIGSSSLRRISVESESSEDELASPQKIYEITPLKSHGIFAEDFVTPAVIADQERGSANANLSFTPLADQLSSWNPSSSNLRGRSRQNRGMFSIGAPATMGLTEQPVCDIVSESPAKSSFFEDEMAMRGNEGSTLTLEDAGDEQVRAALKISQDSQASDEYGDENAEPTVPELLIVEQESEDTVTCTPAKVFTPSRPIQRPGEMYTVSKVPLRPSAEETPLIVPRQRSRSFGGPLAVVNQSHSAQDKNVPLEQPATPVLAPACAPQTPSSGIRLDAETPGRSVRKGVIPDVLKGAVVHVDVHTTEGADASGIFIDLLTQMGARCVKQWHWNPRASMGSSLDSSASPQEASPEVTASKVGITHVVYKDGGKRTLEKVRNSNGLVHCVGVGWVLE